MTGTDRADRRPVASADVCVVGSGPGGALVADALAGKGHSVVVLEAGERHSVEDRTRRMELWLRSDVSHNAFWLEEERDRYTSSGSLFARLNQVRAKGVGGSSLLWNGNTPRLHEKDFEMASRYGVGVDWPLGYADLAPYYDAAEREMGVSGSDDNPHGPPRSESFPMPAFPPSHSDGIFARACESLGIDMASQPKAIASEPYDGRASCSATGVCNACPVGARYTSEHHVDRAVERGAHVVDRAQVLELHTDDRGERVVAAEYATPGGERYRQEADVFVLAAGGIETPRLLLLSDSDAHPDGLANGSGAVGRYLMDHAEIEVRATVDEPTWQNTVGFTTSRSDQFYVPDGPTPGTFALVFLNTAGGGVGEHTRKSAAIKQVFGALGDPGVGTLTDAAADPFNSSTFGDALLDGVPESGGNVLGMRAVAEVLPRPENRVTLDPSTTDNHGRPVPNVSLSYGDHERRTLERAEEVCREVMAELGATDTLVVGYEDSDMGSHHLGTTRMGTDPATSVVDATGRTHEVENLYVSSSSVFPTGGAVNPTLTIAALALRVADSVDARL
ncbi:GMC family oxidoreductase [Halomarina litorea]|uniref:GMC family oxidoreductase n=1 Tax=Halomarina litorea TaxID=2961595 RepID=UPI0020C20220|nr:GMC family oxidoreductase [Halomarina sp. BCD28]